MSNIAEALIEIGAVGWQTQNPITFKSGIRSPVYVDNRVLPSYPEQWRQVILGLAEIVESKKLDFDYIAGVESAGIPHSAALGFHLSRPSVFVRKKAKEHGTKKMVEGGDVSGKKVVLVEDLVTTGGSSLAGVRALRESGAVVSDCLSIVNYGFPESTQAFSGENVTLHHLVSFAGILETAIAGSKISKHDAEVVESFLQDPHNWTEKYDL